MALIMIFSRTLSKSYMKEKYVRCLIYFFMAVLYMEAVIVTLRHPELPVVTFIGVLLVLPLLFVDYPIFIIIAQSMFVAVFCLIVSKYKSPDISSTDIWNGITFLFASWVEILILIPMRINSMQKTREIVFISKNNRLTRVMNRNAYEEHITMISKK